MRKAGKGINRNIFHVILCDFQHWLTVETELKVSPEEIEWIYLSVKINGELFFTITTEIVYTPTDTCRDAVLRRELSLVR